MVLKTKVILLMVFMLLIAEKLIRFDADDKVHAVVLGAALMESWHPVSVLKEKADVKVTDTSKLVLNVVIAFNWMVYCEEVDRALLGETVEDVTVKLTCAFRPARSKLRHIQTLKKLISFIRLV